MLSGKNSFYFPHDYNARGDEKITRLLRVLGWEGYGLFWALVEKLYESGGRLAADYEDIAYDLRSKPDVVQRLISDFGLFQTSDGKIGSESVDRRLKKRLEKSESARRGAYAMHATSMHTHSTCNANAQHMQSNIKDKRGEERIREDKKEKTTSPQAPPAVTVAEKPYELKTDLDRIMAAWKVFLGLRFDDREWDKAQYSKWSRAGKKLLSAFDGHGGINSALDFMDKVRADFVGKGWEPPGQWNLNTIASRAWDDPTVRGGKNEPQKNDGQRPPTKRNQKQEQPRRSDDRPLDAPDEIFAGGDF